MKALLKIIILLVSVSIHVGLSACDLSGGECFGLRRLGSHYVFTTTVNDACEATLLLESGIPAMLVDSAYVFSRGVLDGLQLSSADGEKINMGGRMYRITHKGSGEVRIGDRTSYKGDVFVLADYAQDYQAAVPVQGLCSCLDGSRIVRLILENDSLQVLDRQSLGRRMRGYSRNRINADTYLGMPAVKAKLEIGYGKKTRVLKGNFNIDFGNPELVFLMRQHKDVQGFLKNNADIELRNALNPRGEVMAQFILADMCRVLDKDFSDAVIAITGNLPRFTSTGLIGLKFFRASDAILDFDEDRMYLK